jgi:predicted ABC-type ATPase
MPELFILTGSNGAGKSSVGPEYLSPHLRSNVFDGDKLFMQKRSEFWRNGIPSHKECKKMAAEFVEKTFDDLVETVLHQKIDFAYEGHFTNDATWNIPKRFKEEGYKIHLIFLGLKDVTISEARVITRSKEGGHYVDPLTLRSNFYGNLEKLDMYFSIFDSVTIIDTSGTEHIGLVVLNNGICSASIMEYSLPEWFINYLPNITLEINRFKGK